MKLLLALAQVVTAVTIIAFWVHWFNTTHDKPWLPAGFASHERVFVWPDSVAAALLLISATGLLAGWSGSAVTSYVAAGMLLFLAIIDAAYYTQHRLLRLEHGGLGNISLVVGVSTVALASIAYHLTAS